MRRISLFFALLVFSVFTFGQVQKNEIKSKPTLADKIFKTQVHNFPLTSKTPGEVFWSEDFDLARWAASVDTATNLLADPALMPDGWTVFDATGNNFYWHWSQKLPRGRYTSYDPAVGLSSSLLPSTDSTDWLNSATNENGVMMLESDFFNTGPDGQIVDNLIEMNSYIMSPAIDVAGRPGVGIRFSERFRRCCSSSSKLAILISGDYDPANPEVPTHWTEYSVTLGILMSKYPSQNPLIYDFDISDAAVGFDHIYIKWLQANTSHYVWMIDDVELYEPYHNNLIMLNTWADYLYVTPVEAYNDADHFYSGGYTFIPKDMAGEFIQFRGAVYNYAINAQNSVTLNVKIVKNGIEEQPVYDHTSEPLIFSTREIDTCVVSENFTPEGLGEYAVKFQISSENTDEAPENNYGEFDFKISDTVYARNSMNPDNFSSTSPGRWIYSDWEGWQFGLLFDIIGTTSISSLTTYISRNNNDDSIAAGNFKLTGHFMGIDDEYNYFPIAHTEQYIVKPGDEGHFITLPFLDEGNLLIAPGAYYVMLEFPTDTSNANEHFNFYIGEDLSVHYATQSNQLPVCPLFLGDVVSWVNANPVIALNIISDCCLLVPYTFNVNMQPAIDDALFDPASDSVYISGSFNNYGYDLMTNTRGVIYSYTASIPVGDYIKYTYSINKEITDGYKFTTIYASDSSTLPWGTTAIKVNPELARIKIGPNPASNTLHISNLEKVSKIEVSSILGQLICTINHPSQNININTSDLSKGIYLITFTAKDNSKRMERFVKE